MNLPHKSDDTREIARDLHDVLVVRYRDEYRKAFEQLNLEWIERYFEIEQPDRISLSDPLNEIVRPGGEIFFVLEGDEVKGTCALIRHGAETYELAKMAVTPDAQGHGFGNLLIEAIIGEAKSKGAQRILLLSNTVLVPAIKLYEKYGFRTTHLGSHPEYKRANIEMLLNLMP